MHFVNMIAVFLVALATSALAQLQLTTINFPAANSVLTPGSTITVEVAMYDYIQSIDNLVLVIGLQNCYGGQCDPASQTLGSSILYKGPYNAYGSYSTTYHNFYQDVNVTIPAGFPSGPASLGVINLYSVGAENEVSTEYLNLNVTVV